MNRLSDLVLGYRRLVCLLWLLVTVAAVPSAAVTTGRLAFDFSLPGQPGYETSQEILGRYGNGGSTAPLLVVVTVPPGETVDEREPDVAGVFEAVREQLPRTRVVDYTQTRDAVLLTDNGRSTVGLVFVPAPMGFGPGAAAELTPLLAAQAEASGLQVGLTGYDLLAEGGQAEEPEVLVETLLGALGALVVLAFVFASFLALVPLLVAAVSILTTFLAVLGLTVVTDVSFIVQFLVSLIGLGVAIDYSLLMVTRWREERAAGRDNDAAVREAMRTAGGAVVASGGDRRGVAAGAGGAASAVPALHRLRRSADPADLHAGHPDPAARAACLGGPTGGLATHPHREQHLPTLGGVVPRGRALPLAGGRGHPRGAGSTRRAARRHPDRHRAQRVAGQRRPCVRDPADPRAGRRRYGDPHAHRGAHRGRRSAAVVEAVGGVSGVGAVLAPGGPDWSRDGTTIVDVVPEQETVSSSSVAVVDRVREAVEGLGVVGVSGPGALSTDYTGGIYSSFPLVLTVIVVATFLLLARTFRSVLLPLKAIALNLLSVAATFGATVLIWQQATARTNASASPPPAPSPSGCRSSSSPSCSGSRWTTRSSSCRACARSTTRRDPPTPPLWKAWGAPVGW